MCVVCMPHRGFLLYQDAGLYAAWTVWCTRCGADRDRAHGTGASEEHNLKSHSLSSDQHSLLAVLHSAALSGVGCSVTSPWLPLSPFSSFSAPLSVSSSLI